MIIALIALWLRGLGSGAGIQAERCTLTTWLTKHQGDSALRVVAADSLDHRLESLGRTGPWVPPSVTLQGIGAEIVVLAIVDSLGTVISTDPQEIHISRYQGGLSPEEIRRWTPLFDTSTVRYLRGQRYAPPTHRGSRVTVMYCVTVRFTPIPDGKKFNVGVSATP